MQPDPWAFGWTQALTLLGFAITGLIAWGGFRSFNRWKREQLEGRRIEIAFDLLAITYESKYVFDNIRSPMSFPYEWEDLPKRPGETEEQWRSRGSYYAVRKRVSEAKPFFDRYFNSNQSVWRFLAHRSKPRFYCFTSLAARSRLPVKCLPRKTQTVPSQIRLGRRNSSSTAFEDWC